MTLSDLNPYTWLIKIGAAIAIILGLWYGYYTIEKAFAERNALKTQVAGLNDQLASERTARNFDVTQANLTTETYRLELAVRTQIANDAAARSATITKELSRDQSVIAAWRAQADANLRACLATPLPAGLFDRPAKAAAAADSGH